MAHYKSPRLFYTSYSSSERSKRCQSQHGTRSMLIVLELSSIETELVENATPRAALDVMRKTGLPIVRNRHV